MEVNYRPEHLQVFVDAVSESNALSAQDVVPSEYKEEAFQVTTQSELAIKVSEFIHLSLESEWFGTLECKYNRDGSEGMTIYKKRVLIKKHIEVCWRIKCNFPSGGGDFNLYTNHLFNPPFTRIVAVAHLAVTSTKLENHSNFMNLIPLFLL